MIKNNKFSASIVAAISIPLVLVFFLLPRISADLPTADSAEDNISWMNLGITYLRVTPELSDYYNLGVDSGVIITEVTPGSTMDMADVKAGDVICSCNGIELNEDVSLLKLLREALSDDTVMLEICRGGDCRMIGCCQDCGTSECTCGCSTVNDECK